MCDHWITFRFLSLLSSFFLLRSSIPPFPIPCFFFFLSSFLPFFPVCVRSFPCYVSWENWHSFDLVLCKVQSCNKGWWCLLQFARDNSERSLTLGTIARTLWFSISAVHLLHSEIVWVFGLIRFDAVLNRAIGPCLTIWHKYIIKSSPNNGSRWGIVTIVEPYIRIKIVRDQL